MEEEEDICPQVSGTILPLTAKYSFTEILIGLEFQKHVSLV
jgi:hypothetical protein